MGSAMWAGRVSITFSKVNDSKVGRDKSIYDSHMKHGYTLKEIADYLGIHYSAVSKVISKEIRTEVWLFKT